MFVVRCLNTVGTDIVVGPEGSETACSALSLIHDTVPVAYP